MWLPAAGSLQTVVLLTPGKWAATPLLPQEVQRQGLIVAKATQNFLMFVGLYSADGSHNDSDLSDYIVSKLQYPLARVVSPVEIGD